MRSNSPAGTGCGAGPAQVLGEPGASRRRDGVHPHAVATELGGADDREGGDAHLGGAVVRLADVAEQPRRRRRVDHRPADGLPRLGPLPPVGGGVAHRSEVALEVDADHGVPLRLGHVREHPVAQDAGVVDEHVQVAEGLHRRVDQALGGVEVGDVVVVGDGLAAGRLDLGHDLLGRRGVGAGALGRSAEVVHHDLGALGGEQERVLPPDPPPCSGDDGHPALELVHVSSPWCAVADRRC